MCVLVFKSYIIRAWRDGSVGKVFALQSWGPQFDLLQSGKSWVNMVDHAYNSSNQRWRQKDRFKVILRQHDPIFKNKTKQRHQCESWPIGLVKIPFLKNTVRAVKEDITSGLHTYTPGEHNSTNMGIGTHKIDKVKWSRPPHASIYIYRSTNVHKDKNTTYFTRHCAIAH